MRIARTSYLALTCCLLLSACAKTSGGQTGDEDAIGGSEFYADLAKQQGSGNYRPASGVSDLVGRSERVAVAHGVAIHPGRRFMYPSDSKPSYQTVMLELAVDRNLKGSASNSLYLEFYVGDAEANAPQRVPADRVIVFAVRAPAQPFKDIEVIDAADLPAGETLYELTTPQGFALADEGGGFTQPFEKADRALGSGDFDDLVARAAAVVDNAGPDGGSDASAVGPDGSIDDAGSAAGPDGSTGCPGEGATQCSAECFAVTATPYDQANNCLDYNAQIVIGCNDGIGPPIIACVVRVSDGQMFTLGGGNPYPTSTVYRACSDQSVDIFSAPACP